MTEIIFTLVGFTAGSIFWIFKNRMATLRAELIHNKKISDLNNKLSFFDAKLSSSSIEFQNIASSIVESKSALFDNLIISPLKEKLSAFENKVDRVYSAGIESKTAISSEIQSLGDISRGLSAEANNLAMAMKGGNKQQGLWGEFVLEKLLESSGLRKDLDYSSQQNLTGQDGNRLQPDVLVNLPNGKHIIVDSKVSLSAYLNYIAGGQIKPHLDSIKSHIKLLSDKKYFLAQNTRQPDFVIAFFPIESAFTAAMEHDKSLFQNAWDKDVVLASPSTLFPILKTVSFVWREKYQSENSILIAEEGGKMYDRLVLFHDDLTKVGKKIDEVKTSYDDALSKLSTGAGNIIKRADKMKELGARATKSIN